MDEDDLWNLDERVADSLASLSSIRTAIFQNMFILNDDLVR